MAWTTPRTWNQGETITSTMMNLHVRDNMNWLYTEGQVSSYGQWCRIYRNTDQSIANATAVPIQFDTLDSDGEDWKNGYTIEVPEDGDYYITAAQMYQSNTTGTRYIIVYDASQGTGYEFFRVSRTAGAGDGWTRYGIYGRVYPLTAGTLIGAWGYQNSGGALNFIGVSTYGYSNHLALFRVR